MAKTTLDAFDLSLEGTIHGATGAQNLANSMSGTTNAVLNLGKASLLNAGKFGNLTVHGVGVGLGFAGVVLTGVQIWEDGGLNASNGTDLFFDGVAFIPGVGWVISGAYFITNTIVTAKTGQSIGQHLNNAINSIPTETIEASAAAMGSCP